VHALKSRAAAADDELARLSAARDSAYTRADRALHEFTALETKVAGLDAGEEGLDAEYEGAAAELADLDDRLAKAREEAASAERDRSALAARKEALELGLTRKDGAGALLAAADSLSGVLGSVAVVVSVQPGYETALAAALGQAADAVAVERPHDAVSAIGHLKEHDLGRSGILLGGAAGHETTWPSLPAGAAYAIDVLDAPATLMPSLRRLLAGVAVVDALDHARRLVDEHPDLTAVTRDGDVLSAHFACGGSTSRPSLLEVQAALDETGARLDEATRACDRLAFETSRLEAERGQAQRRVDVALAKLHESDATLAAVAEQLAEFGALARSARAEADRLTEAITEAEQARERDLAGLTDLEQRLAAAEQSPEQEPDTAELDRVAEEAKAARARETEARLALRTAEERARALAGRVESLRQAAQAEQDTRARVAARRERLRHEGAAAAAVAHGAAVLMARLETALAEAASRRTAVEQARHTREQQLLDTRARLRELSARHDELVSTVHRDEMARTQQRMRLEQLEERALDELGLDGDTLVAEFGPDQPVPATPGVDSPEAADGQGSEPPPSTPYVREEQAKRFRAAERALAVLGKVNPLALEEFSALEERHKFLSEQVDDLKRTRRDLLDIVREVDEQVEQVFTDAYRDVAAAFEVTFARLFPGGEGRLLLTEPDNMLATGIDVEARPAGKKLKRLSLLSGGERSLVAVAFLVALFKARPSPFYILDEVEAALDDVNLGRLLEIYEELREDSQLLVITHQKRTMEIGDALYGVTMRDDGVSTVISQRLREAQSA
jgi:chromosome segregation protein